MGVKLVDERDLQGDRVAHATEEERQRARVEFREALAKGEIDLGPVPDQSDKIEDIRDMRDPEHLGQLISETVTMEGVSVRNAADYFASPSGRLEVREYQDGFIDHAALRLKELEDRAAQGDKFAQALLDGDSLAEDPTD